MNKSRKIVERIPRVMLLVVLLAALYTGWIFYARWSSERMEKHNAEIREAERLRKEVELNGGDTLKITVLYASPSFVHRGGSAQLCYGVANATEVHFDPEVPEVWPSRDRCVDVSPKRTTLYTLTTKDGANHMQTAQVTIQVK